MARRARKLRSLFYRAALYDDDDDHDGGGGRWCHFLPFPSRVADTAGVLGDQLDTERINPLDISLFAVDGSSGASFGFWKNGT